jgi:hypothetical protein
MDIMAISSELKTRNIKHVVVIAATTKKDGENPPYSRQRYLSGLNDKRLGNMYLLASAALNSFGDTKKFKAIAKQIPSMDFNKRHEALLDLHIGAQGVWEFHHNMDDMVQGFAEAGVFGYISGNALRYAQRLEAKDASEDKHLVGDTADMFERVAVNAVKRLQKSLGKILAEVRKRGYTEPQFEKFVHTNITPAELRVLGIVLR